MNFWLINLFVAVITNTFKAIRAETKSSAFGSEGGIGGGIFDALSSTPANKEKDKDEEIGEKKSLGASGVPRTTRSGNKLWLKKALRISNWLFVLLAVASLVLQSTASSGINISEVFASSSPFDNQSEGEGEARDRKNDIIHLSVIYYGEVVITILFDIEIVARFISYLPDWRGFFVRRHNTSEGADSAHSSTSKTQPDGHMFSPPLNVLDTLLAVTTSIILIPPIHNSEIYPWLTFTQLTRFYRFILVVPRMRPLLTSLFSNFRSLFNMSLFLLLINLLSGLVAIQFLRGDLSEGENMNFGDLWTGFLGVYQVFSSEDWVRWVLNLELI